MTENMVLLNLEKSRRRWFEMYNTTKPYKKDILRMIRTTWETPYVSVKGDGIILKKLVPSTTKSLISLENELSSVLAKI